MRLYQGNSLWQRVLKRASLNSTLPLVARTGYPVRMQSLQYVDGEYHTPARRVFWFARTFPSLVFHARYALIVFRSSWQAMRGKYGDEAWSDSSLAVLRALESVGVEFEITGIDYLREVEGPCLVIGNHMSSLETMVLPCLVQPIKKVTFVVKQSLLTYPVFGHVMRSRDPVAVTQTDPRRDLKSMLEGGLDRLRRGISLIVFPEGARATKFNPQRFNTIGVKLASRAGVPIVPVALRTDAWGAGNPSADFGRIDPKRKVRFAFGPAIQVTGRGTVEQEAIIQFLEHHLAKWDSTT
ncbi:2-acyl-glycerophospho-ethanolamine acyltransferase [Bythopirellula polymerisocia]|uniref:2-acyl-glycerophospho-ethanolamine acyltransferase n=2 Tax=Bythopirellula polymerisocia TaxID=2528003 RepID=A0A5C6CZ41_9BACT|nr:2-acyl-glycerophospho-ethanolamine acyltransferase [Bythopirellula polymerisocia]